MAPRDRDPTVTTTSYDGMRTRQLETAGDGPPILLLHGFSDSADTWRPVLRELAAMGRHAIAVDLPGFGRAAPAPAPRGPLLPTLDRFVHAVVDALDQPVVVAGNSVGGVLTLRVAASRPDDIVAAAPIDPAGFGFHRGMERLQRRVAVAVPLLRLAYRVPYPGPLIRPVIAQYYRRQIMQRRLDDPQLASHYASHFRSMHDVRRIGALGRQLWDELALGAVAPLHEVTTPTLVMWGRQDPICHVSGAEALVRALPNARTEILDRCGHMPQIQYPAHVAQRLAELPRLPVESPSFA